MDKGTEEQQSQNIAEKVKAASPQQPGVTGCSRGVEWTCLAMLVIFLGMCAFSLVPHPQVRDKAKEAEVKANLHRIQLALERYAVDHDWTYPRYLIGGEARYAAQVDLQNHQQPFQGISDCRSLASVSDVLLREGYLDAYPRNPFVRSGSAIHEVQSDLPSSEVYGCDPLRNATPEAAIYGTRFGPENTTMGSVLADPRYRAAEYMTGPDGGMTESPTYADVEYEFWDMWHGNKPLPYMPGHFFYKGLVPVIATEELNSVATAFLPLTTDLYMLCAYGGIRTKGQDVLGPEQALTLPMPRPPSPGENTASEFVTAWPMTRSEVSDDLSKREGCPFSLPLPGDTSEQLMYQNPNGLPDAIILVLTAGGDYP